MSTNTGSMQTQLFQLYQNLGGVVLPDQNSNSYSTQGWLAQINSLVEGGIGLGNGQVINGQVINGTAFFVTDTKPTTRIGGGALVAGDKWYKSDDGTEWFWNGTYWLSDYLFSFDGGSSANTGGLLTNTTVSGLKRFRQKDASNCQPWLLESLDYYIDVVSADTGANYLQPRLYLGADTTGGATALDPNVFFTAPGLAAGRAIVNQVGLTNVAGGPITKVNNVTLIAFGTSSCNDWGFIFNIRYIAE